MVHLLTLLMIEIAKILLTGLKSLFQKSQKGTIKIYHAKIDFLFCAVVQIIVIQNGGQMKEPRFNSLLLSVSGNSNDKTQMAGPICT